MKKRILTLLLAVVMLLSMAPATPALADSVDNYEVVFSTYNTAAVENVPKYYPDFTVGSSDLLVQAVTTYHWNRGQGSTPGTISILDWDDNLIGTWQATGRGGSGASNVNWDIFPNVVLKANTRYYFVDSDEDTWSWNTQSDYTGFVEVRGTTNIQSTPQDNGTDLRCSNWALDEMRQADYLGIIPESIRYTDLTAPITRAEFAGVSVRAYQRMAQKSVSPASSNPFTDTNDPDVLRAYAVGITNGTSATTFSPNDLLTREQGATMLARAYKKTVYSGWSLSSDTSYLLEYPKTYNFDDHSGISSWASNSVYFMSANSIVNGVGNNMFAPKNIMTREQAIAIAVRMLENLDTSPKENPNTSTEIEQLGGSGGVVGPANKPVSYDTISVDTNGQGTGRIAIIPDTPDDPDSAASKVYDLVLAGELPDNGIIDVSIEANAPSDSDLSVWIYYGLPYKDVNGNTGYLWQGAETKYENGKATASIPLGKAKEIFESADFESVTDMSYSMEPVARVAGETNMLHITDKERQAQAMKIEAKKERVTLSSDGHFRLHIPGKYTTPGGGYLEQGDMKRMLDDFMSIFAFYKGKGFKAQYEGQIIYTPPFTTKFPLDVYGTDETSTGSAGIYYPATGNMDLAVNSLNNPLGYRRKALQTNGTDRAVLMTAAHELFHCVQRDYVGKAGASTWFDEASAAWYEQEFINSIGSPGLDMSGYRGGAEGGYTYEQYKGMIPDAIYFSGRNEGYRRMPFIDYCQRLDSDFVKKIYSSGGSYTESMLRNKIVEVTKKSLTELAVDYYTELVVKGTLLAEQYAPWGLYDLCACGNSEPGFLSETISGGETTQSAFYHPSHYGATFQRLELKNTPAECESFNIRPYNQGVKLVVMVFGANSYDGMEVYTANAGQEVKNIPIQAKRYLVMCINTTDSWYDDPYTIKYATVSFNAKEETPEPVVLQDTSPRSGTYQQALDGSRNYIKFNVSGGSGFTRKSENSQYASLTAKPGSTISINYSGRSYWGITVVGSDANKTFTFSGELEESASYQDRNGELVSLLDNTRDVPYDTESSGVATITIPSDIMANIYPENPVIDVEVLSKANVFADGGYYSGNTVSFRLTITVNPNLAA